MKLKIVSIALIFSLIFNALLFEKMFNSTDTRDPRQIAYGISSTMKLVYLEFEQFDIVYSEYTKGNIDKIQLYDEARKTSASINYLGLILESYEILPYEYLQSIYKFSEFFSNFESNPDEYNITSIKNIKNIFRENSNVTVYQIYKDYPNLINGNIPSQLKALFVELNKQFK